ncbi:hypothetical protein X741_23585 [Mesorhizobium sp. LNHC229A00]|nr:hypothetical protein X741_23585 [Mesorhizobium sp. LNHC229A00]
MVIARSPVLVTGNYALAAVLPTRFPPSVVRSTLSSSRKATEIG